MPVSPKTRIELGKILQEVAEGFPNKLYTPSAELIAAVLEQGKVKYSYTSLREALSTLRKSLGIDAQLRSSSKVGDAEYINIQKKKIESGKESKELKNREKVFLAEIQRLEKLLEASGHLSKTPQIYKIEKQKAKHSQSTPIIIASDWHYEEEVKSNAVSGLNEFNLAIADERINNFIRNSTRLLDIHSRDTEIREVILVLGGDFISGDIHRDIIESCQLSPAEAIWTVQNHLISCIEFYLRHTDFKFIIPCHSGNHARTTQEQMWANEAGHSLEWLMYHSIKKIFEKEKRLTFQIAEGIHLYTQVGGFTVRSQHGHAIKFNGGVGGLTIPMNKAIAQWNKAKWANHDIACHYHTLFTGNNFTINGSLIGFSPYALKIKADFEKPAQAFQVINHEQNMISMNAKIFLE